MDLENLVRNMLKEMLPLLEKKVLIFFSGGSVNSDILLKLLADINYKHFDLVLSESAKSVLNQEAVQKLNGRIIHSINELEEAAANAQLVLIPIMTRNTLAKTALGIADNLVTTGIARVLMMNKEVLAVKDSFDNSNPINIANELSRNSPYNSMLESYENQLKQFGVKFIDLAEFKTVIQYKLAILPTGLEKIKPDNLAYTVRENGRNFKQNEVHINSSILTQADLREYSDDVVITVKPNTIITSLAKDYIASNHIKLKFLSE